MAFNAHSGGIGSGPRRTAAQRIAGFGTSVFTEMSRLAAACGAVNLGQGFPDFEAPDFVKQAAIDAIAAGHNQYAPAHGITPLRQAIARKWQSRHGVSLDPETEITVTQGATEALLAVCLALLDPGDEAIVFQPFYDAYVPDIQMAGGVPVFARLNEPDWHLDMDAVAAAFSSRTRLLFLNTPHNPTGKVFTPAELDALGALAVRHDTIIVADEVYSEILFDGVQHVPIATRPGLRERVITIDSIGKTFSVTGWKIGWTIAPPALTNAIRAVHQFSTFCNATPFQHAAAMALEKAATSGYYEELRQAYAARRATLRSHLNEAGLPCLPAAGAYFLMADFASTGFEDDVTFCRHLMQSVGVAAIPPSVFYRDPQSAPRVARFCFAKRDETLAEVGRRLTALR